jgi:hypothetical protein
LADHVPDTDEVRAIAQLTSERSRQITGLNAITLQMGT